MKRILFAAGFLALMVFSASAGTEHIGKKIKFVMKSGEEVVGVLKSETSDSVLVETETGLRTLKSADVEKAAVVHENTGLVIEDEPASPRAGPSGPSAYHRLGIVSLGAGSESGGLEISYYEYIAQNRWSVKVSLLNFQARSKPFQETWDDGYWRYTATESVDTMVWAPLWVRKYLVPADSRAWPYLGAGLAYRATTKYHYVLPDEDKSGFIPAAEAGLDFGGKMLRGSVGLLYFPGGSDTSILTVNVGLSLLWKA